MPVIERQSKDTEENSESSIKKLSEKQAKAFVSEGTMPAEKKFLSFTLKIPEAMAKEIDELCKNECAYLSRRSWIVQAAAEKLQRIKKESEFLS